MRQLFQDLNNNKQKVSLMKNFNFFRKTSFAPAERENEEQIMSQAEKLKAGIYDNSILNMMPDLIIVLNAKRQAIFVNKSLLTLLGKEDDLSLLGLRPGELFDCAHAENDSGGCGTSNFCKVCGAVKSILATQKYKVEHESKCEILTKSGLAYNLKVWTFPFGDNILFIIRNIENEVYRVTLEHIFFHDLANIGSGLYGLLDMIKGNCETFMKYEKLLTGLAKEMLEEISSQRDLLLMEQDALCIRVETVNNIEMIKSVADMLSTHQVARDKNIVVDEKSESIDIKTDIQLLKRVIINMTKNALEASDEGDSVSLKTVSQKDKVIFEVHNDSFIPEETQLKIFNRSFSTKGRGRGLGTYSMKLLSENYLQGKAYFTSDAQKGTSFFVEYPIELNNS